MVCEKEGTIGSQQSKRIWKVHVMNRECGYTTACIKCSDSITVKAESTEAAREQIIEAGWHRTPEGLFVCGHCNRMVITKISSRQAAQVCGLSTRTLAEYRRLRRRGQEKGPPFYEKDGVFAYYKLEDVVTWAKGRRIE